MAFRFTAGAFAAPFKALNPQEIQQGIVFCSLVSLKGWKIQTMLSPRGYFQIYRRAHPSFWYGSLARDASALSSKNKHCIRISSFNTAKYFYASRFYKILNTNAIFPTPNASVSILFGTDCFELTPPVLLLLMWRGSMKTVRSVFQALLSCKVPACRYCCFVLGFPFQQGSVVCRRRPFSWD